MELKITFRTDEMPNADIAERLREIAKRVQERSLDPDIRRPIRAANGVVVGYYVLESPLRWPEPMTMGDL